MYHGLRFDRTGQVVEIPGQRKIPSSLRVRGYPVVERHGWIWVWMGDAKVAEESLVPVVTGLDDSDYACGSGQMDYEAEARFVNDNLLDLSHVSFLHTQTARSTENWARERVTISERERGVHVERWVSGGYSTVEGDIYSRYEFFVPGIFLYTEDVYPLGTANALNGTPPADLDREPRRNFALQAITPITEKTARALYIVAAHRDHGGEAKRDATMSVVPKIFAEDKAMVEAQQRIIDATPDWRFIATSADRGVALFNRLVERLSREEVVASKNNLKAAI
jgi:vanillate O-demethylase monooxygenase subunit